ncbi:hypothetical protein P8452_49815 [Trifolium repens]|nr:hypothetical protein P8452_49815 [Trifolium repens]
MNQRRERCAIHIWDGWSVTGSASSGLKSSKSKAYEKGLMIAFIPFTSKALEPCQWEYTIKMLMDYY